MSRHSRPLTVACLSASTLAYEILLVRVFAIAQFHHFAFMAISIAMLGFATSGTLLALLRPEPKRARLGFVASALMTPAALIVSVALVHRIPMDPTQLPWDPWGWLRLVGIYLLLALPFGVAAIAILLALTLEQRRPGSVYGASFLGAGLGAVIGVAVLWVVFPVRALAVPALLAACGSFSAVWDEGRRMGSIAGAMAILAVAAFLRPPWTLNVTPYKGLPQVEAYPDARRVAESTSPLGWVVAVEAAAFRHAPGLSLSYRGAFPKQTALFVDGELAGAASPWGPGEGTAILDWLPSAAPYSIGGRIDVLILGAGGGMEVWNALSHGAKRVTAVELDPRLPGLGGWREDRGLPTGAEIDWIIGDARAYVARSDEEFDLITIGPGRSFGTSGGGVHALNEDFLHTVEAYARYLERLGPQGVLAITRWIMLPPRQNLRVILTAAQALRRVAPGSLANGLVVMRSWATGTVLVKPAGFSEEELERLTVWADERRFDLDWAPGLEATAAEYNLMDEPVLYEAAAAAVAGPDSAARFAASQVFDIAPLNDARPFPHHFLRAGSLGEFFGRDRGSWLAFAEWGYLALVATLVQSLGLAALLLIVPVAIRARSESPHEWARLIGYFGAIGFAYLAAEIAAIQQLSLLLGHPVYAVAAVLAAFLVFSGLGSAWSDRLETQTVSFAGAALAGALLFYAAALLTLVHLLQPTHASLRLTAGLLLMAPLALGMGLPFPLGLRSVAGSGTEAVAWAWAANGFMSVVATPLAALIALEAGSRVLFLTAAFAYAAAAALGRGWKLRQRPSRPR